MELSSFFCNYGESIFLTGALIVLVCSTIGLIITERRIRHLENLLDKMDSRPKPPPNST